MPTWDHDTVEAIFYDLRQIDTYVRLSGKIWQDMLDALAIKYGIEPDGRPRLALGIGIRPRTPL